MNLNELNLDNSINVANHISKNVELLNLQAHIMDEVVGNLDDHKRLDKSETALIALITLNHTIQNSLKQQTNMIVNDGMKKFNRSNLKASATK